MCFSCYLPQYYYSFIRNQVENIELRRKVRRRICVTTVTFWLHVLLLMSFFVAFLSIPTYKEKKFAPENDVCVWGKARVRGCCPSTLPLPLSYSPVSGPTPFQFDEGYCKFWDTKHLQKNKYEILCILLMVNNMFVDEENKNCF